MGGEGAEGGIETDKGGGREGEWREMEREREGQRDRGMGRVRERERGERETHTLEWGRGWGRLVDVVGVSTKAVKVCR